MYISETRLYRTWSNMRQWCSNSNKPDYKYYGGKGIKVCKEWDEDFLAFQEWAYANGYAEDLTIDRIDTSGNYEPSNCRWATRKEQTRNREITHKLTIDGVTKSVGEWAEIYNISVIKLLERKRKGMPLQRIISINDLRKGCVREKSKIKVVNLKDKYLFPSIQDAAQYYNCSGANITRGCKRKITWIKLSDYAEQLNVSEEEAEKGLFFVTKEAVVYG